jgi:hypothetical protein
MKKESPSEKWSSKALEMGLKLMCWQHPKAKTKKIK